MEFLRMDRGLAPSAWAFSGGRMMEIRKIMIGIVCFAMLFHDLALSNWDFVTPYFYFDYLVIPLLILPSTLIHLAVAHCEGSWARRVLVVMIFHTLLVLMSLTCFHSHLSPVESLLLLLPKITGRVVVYMILVSTLGAHPWLPRGGPGPEAGPDLTYR